MKFKMLSTVAIFSGALIAQAGSLPFTAAEESNQATRLLKAIKADAEEIHSSADNIERLARNPNTSWQSYDQQWNMIKPLQERMALSMQRLEGMSASLSPAEQPALEQAKRDVDKITRTTHELWVRIDQLQETKGPALNADARHLDQAARDLIKAIASTS
jgi:hypothetical protein